MELRQYDDAVHTIYDAAIDPQRWPACLARMCALFGGQAGLLFTPVHSPAQGGFAFTHNISQGIVERWGAKSITDDVYVRKGTQLGLLTDGVSVNGDDIVPREELLTSPFYRDIWEPAGLFRASIGIVLPVPRQHRHRLRRQRQPQAAHGNVHLPGAGKPAFRRHAR